VARQILQQAPEASCYSTCMEKQTPLLVAAGKGHARGFRSELGTQHSRGSLQQLQVAVAARPANKPGFGL
jgi:hypothetical protein